MSQLWVVNEQLQQPQGPKGWGTLKTCAVCIEDYRQQAAMLVVKCTRITMPCACP